MSKRSCREHGFSNCITCKEIKLNTKHERLSKKSESLTKKRKESKLSKGETEVAKVLESLYLTYEREKSFKGLYNHNNRSLLYYDFYIPSKNLCIEFDGSQHYAVDKKESEQVNDFKKNMYCKKNNINLLRIKYTDIDKVESIIIERLDLLSSKGLDKDKTIFNHKSNGFLFSSKDNDLWDSL
jgi:very-short-patch-repair endonuclease